MKDKIDINKILINKLITHPSERPLEGFVRNILLGILIGIFLIIIEFLRGRTEWHGILAYLICGVLISFFGWGAERYWYSLIAHMFKKPFSFYAYLSRLPLWWMAGGIGYTTGLLFAYKMNLIFIQVVPVKNIFFFGSFIGIIFQGLMQLRVVNLLKGNS